MRLLSTCNQFEAWVSIEGVEQPVQGSKRVVGAEGRASSGGSVVCRDGKRYRVHLNGTRYLSSLPSNLSDTDYNGIAAVLKIDGNIVGTKVLDKQEGLDGEKVWEGVYQSLREVRGFEFECGEGEPGETKSTTTITTKGTIEFLLLRAQITESDGKGCDKFVATTRRMLREGEGGKGRNGEEGSLGEEGDAEGDERKEAEQREDDEEEEGDGVDVMIKEAGRSCTRLSPICTLPTPHPWYTSKTKPTDTLDKPYRRLSLRYGTAAELDIPDLSARQRLVKGQGEGEGQGLQLEGWKGIRVDVDVDVEEGTVGEVDELGEKKVGVKKVGGRRGIEGIEKCQADIRAMQTYVSYADKARQRYPNKAIHEEEHCAAAQAYNNATKNQAVQSQPQPQPHQKPDSKIKLQVNFNSNACIASLPPAVKSPISPLSAKAVKKNDPLPAKPITSLPVDINPFPNQNPRSEAYERLRSVLEAGEIKREEECAGLDIGVGVGMNHGPDVRARRGWGRVGERSYGQVAGAGAGLGLGLGVIGGEMVGARRRVSPAVEWWSLGEGEK